VARGLGEESTHGCALSLCVRRLTALRREDMATTTDCLSSDPLSREPLSSDPLSSETP